MRIAAAASSVEGPSSELVVSGVLEPSASLLGAVVYLLAAVKPFTTVLPFWFTPPAMLLFVYTLVVREPIDHGGSIVVVKDNP